jgi:hypothetical protein
MTAAAVHGQSPGEPRLDDLTQAGVRRTQHLRGAHHLYRSLDRTDGHDEVEAKILVHFQLPMRTTLRMIKGTPSN